LHPQNVGMIAHQGWKTPTTETRNEMDYSRAR
jgi:hypothetical protein